MNIIKTVGDLKKALSAYSDDLPLEFMLQNKDSKKINIVMNNDTQICKMSDGEQPAKVVMTYLDR